MCVYKDINIVCVLCVCLRVRVAGINCIMIGQSQEARVLGNSALKDMAHPTLSQGPTLG